MNLNYDIQPVLDEFDVIIASNNFFQYNSTTSNSPTLTLFNGLITPKSIIRVDNSCSLVTLEDLTDWTPITGAPPATITLTAAFVYRTEFGDDIQGSDPDCPVSQVFTPNDTLDFIPTLEDGRYCVIVTAVYDDGLGTILTETYEECIDLTCCLSKVPDIKCEIANKIATTSCLLNKYKKIGRPSGNLYQNMHVLENLYWSICNVDLTCDELDLIQCAVSKIKSYKCK
jgi:hypothetical protein